MSVLKGSIVKRIALLMGLMAGGLSLSGCSEIQLASHLFKKALPPEQVAEGMYKVGNPYKIGGKTYYPDPDLSYKEEGIASWYGPGFHGKKTANGEVYNQDDITAAHQTLPMPSIVQVTNLDNGRSLKVRINDRGPYAHNRIIDLSQKSAELLGVVRTGTARVRVEVVKDESVKVAEAARKGSITNLDMQVAENISPNIESVPGDKDTIFQIEPASHLPNLAARPQVTEDPFVYIQVASFKDKVNAEKMRAQFASLAKSDINSVEVNQETYHRVILGPFNTSEDADHVLEKLLNRGVENPRIYHE